MLGASVNLKLAELSATEAVLRDHAPDRVLDEKHWATLAEDAWGFHLLAADVAGEAGVDLVIFLGAGEGHLVGIDHYDEVTSVDVRGENDLVLAAQKAGSFHGDLA